MGDWKKWLSYIGCAAMLLILFAFSAYFVGFHRGEDRGTYTGGGGTGANCNILFPTGAGSDQEIGQAINQWIAEHFPNSPLKGKGALFSQSGRTGGVNPALIVAIARKESSMGKNIPHNSYNPFGRKASASQPAVIVDGVRWYKFNSWDEAILEEGPYIKRVYLDEGRTTLGKLLEKYAPPSGNDTQKYVEEVAGWINEMTSLAGGALGNGCVETIKFASCDAGYSGSPASPCGWIELPNQPEYYTKYGGGQHWGKPKLINMVIGVAKSFQENHNSKIQVGDMSGRCTKAGDNHVSHDRGTDVDIDIPNGMIVDGVNYQRSLAVEAAKMFIKCGATDIGYQDTKVENEVNNWAKQNNLPGRIRNWTGHKNHFHVRIETR